MRLTRVRKEGAMPSRQDPLRLVVKLVIYLVLGYLGLAVFGWVLLGLGLVLGAVTTVFAAAWTTNWLSLKIYEDLSMTQLGLWWRRASAQNLVLGVAGGAVAACLVLVAPLLSGGAHFTRTPAEQPSFGAFV